MGFGVAGMLRNRWPASSGIGGRNQSEWVAGFARNRRPESRGICNQCEEIRLLLFKLQVKIPDLYRSMKTLLESNKVFISQSYFKSMLMDSDYQKCNLDKRLEVVNLIFEYLDADKINAVYEGRKYKRERKIRSIMKILEIDHIDRKEYSPDEVLMHAYENLPESVKDYWEIELEEKFSL